jgi:hypothetical protein
MGSRLSTSHLSPLLIVSLRALTGASRPSLPIGREEEEEEEEEEERRPFQCAPVAKEYEKRTRDSPRFCAALLPHVAPLLFRDLRALIDRDLPFPTALNEDIEPSILAGDVLALIRPLIGAAIDHHSHVGIGDLDFNIG